jgi:hypothetical protein
MQDTPLRGILNNLFTYKTPQRGVSCIAHSVAPKGQTMGMGSEIIQRHGVAHF